MQPLLSGYQVYLHRRDLYKKFGYDLEAERKEILRKAEPLGSRILEVGSGKGYFTMILAKKAPRLTSIDISQAEQNFARENIYALKLAHKVDFQIADARDLPFDSGSFDDIFCINSFHHMQDTTCVLDELMRVCALHGKIVISDFNKRGLTVVDAVHQSEDRHHHFCPVSWKTLEKLLKKRNFQTSFFHSSHQTSLRGRHQGVKGI